MSDFVEILRCPNTGEPLHWTPNRDALRTANGNFYRFSDGVGELLPESGSSDAPDPSRSIRDFYQSDGWEEDEDGVFTDTKAFLDNRAVSREFTDKCIRRLNKYFRQGGRYILDAGSGPIPHDALLTYGEHFEQRVCVDLSVQGLRKARSKLGDRGIYLQGDLTKLPLRDNSMDAITCNHVLYQVPAEKQAAALHEMWRVLKPGGIAAIVYIWPYSPLARRIEQMAKLFVGDRPGEDHTAMPELSHNPHLPSWFDAQDWPFRIKFESFRLVGHSFLRRYVSDDWRGRLFLNLLFAMQVVAPGFCGRYGTVPTILMYKD